MLVMMGEIATGRVQMALRATSAVAFSVGVLLAGYAWSAGDAGVVPSLLVVIAPAVLVWFLPQPRAIAVWAVFAFSVELQLLGFERFDAPAVRTWVEAFLAVLLAMLPLAGYGARAFTGERATGEPSPLARKLRSIAAVTFLLALGLTVLGFFPGKRYGAHTAAAGGLPLLVLLAIAVGPGLHVYTHPTRTRGWRWTLYVLCLVLPGAVLWSFARDTAPYADSRVTLWPQHVVDLGVGTLLALLLLVLPAVLLFARGDDDPTPTPLPPARLR